MRREPVFKSYCTCELPLLLSASWLLSGSRVCLQVLLTSQCLALCKQRTTSVNWYCNDFYTLKVSGNMKGKLHLVKNLLGFLGGSKALVFQPWVFALVPQGREKRWVTEIRVLLYFASSCKFWARLLCMMWNSLIRRNLVSSWFRFGPAWVILKSLSWKKLSEKENTLAHFTQPLSDTGHYV